MVYHNTFSLDENVHDYNVQASRQGLFANSPEINVLFSYYDLIKFIENGFMESLKNTLGLESLRYGTCLFDVVHCLE